MTKKIQFLFSIFAAALCLLSTACSNNSAMWDNLAYQDSGTQPAFIYGIKD